MIKPDSSVYFLIVLFYSLTFLFHLPTNKSWSTYKDLPQLNLSPTSQAEPKTDELASDF